MTRFKTDTGEIQVTDFMPALTEAQKDTNPIPYRCIIRRIEGVSGSVPVRIALKVRPGYGRRTLAPRRQNHCYEMQWPGKRCT